jgi:hypothetical protein
LYACREIEREETLNDLLGRLQEGAVPLLEDSLFIQF